MFFFRFRRVCVFWWLWLSSAFAFVCVHVKVCLCLCVGVDFFVSVECTRGCARQCRWINFLKWSEGISELLVSTRRGSKRFFVAFKVATPPVFACIMSLLCFLFGVVGACSCDGIHESEKQIAELKAVIAQLQEELFACREGPGVGPGVCVCLVHEAWKHDAGTLHMCTPPR